MKTIENDQKEIEMKSVLLLFLCNQTERKMANLGEYTMAKPK